MSSNNTTITIPINSSATNDIQAIKIDVKGINVKQPGFIDISGIRVWFDPSLGVMVPVEKTLSIPADVLLTEDQMQWKGYIQDAYMSRERDLERQVEKFKEDRDYYCNLWNEEQECHNDTERGYLLKIKLLEKAHREEISKYEQIYNQQASRLQVTDESEDLELVTRRKNERN